MSIEIDAYFPEYMKEFECIGAACPTSCCIGWSVPIDKKTYMQYKNKRNKSEFNKFLMANVRRTKGNPSYTSYAHASLDSQERCVFLNGDNLCNIYINMGHDALGAVCCLYPREHCTIGDKYILYAHLSCPEIARMCLLNKEGLKMVYGKIKIHPKTYFTDVFLQPDKKSIADQYLWEIGGIAKSILQNRGLNIEERLMILGIFISKISKNKEAAAINELFTNFQSSEHLQLYGESLSSINPHYFLQLKSISAISNRIRNLHPRYMEYIKQAHSGIFSHNSNDDIINKYSVDGSYLYKHLLKSNSHIIENYLVNSMLEQLDSFQRYDADEFYQYTILVLKYIMLRTIIIGMLLDNKEIDDILLIDIVSLHNRALLHNYERVIYYMNVIKEENTYSLAGAFILLKLI